MSYQLKVSVIIPTHNHAHFLPECLASVRAQTYKNYEVIIVNNGSTDNTEQVVRDLAWEQVRYYYQEDTGSVAGPRNTGIRLAKGEYVAFLDSDDLWYEQKLEKVMEVLENNTNIDIISHSLFLTRTERKKELLKVGPLKKDMFRFLLIKNPLLGSATVVKRNVMLEIGGFDEDKEVIHIEDSDAWLKIANLGKTFSFIEEAMGEYRVHSSNLSHDFEKVLINEKNVIKRHFKKLKSAIPFYGYLLYSNRLSSIYAKFAIQYFFRKRFIKSLFYFMRSFVFNPFCAISSIFALLLKLIKR